MIISIVPLTLWDSFADSGSQIVQIKAIKPRGIFQREIPPMDSRRKASFLIKMLAVRVFRQQITDSYFAFSFISGPIISE